MLKGGLRSERFLLLDQIIWLFSFLVDIVYLKIEDFFTCPDFTVSGLVVLQFDLSLWRLRDFLYLYVFSIKVILNL